jgi:hypothetical protein
MANDLYFIKDSKNYYNVGQPSDYYFDFGLIPIDSFPCNDILEKTRLLCAFWELVLSIDTSSNKNQLITSDLLIDLKKYFNQYDAPDFAYWALLEYETLANFDTTSCCYEIDSVSKNMVLSVSDIKIIIPHPYYNIFGEDENGDLNDVDETNYADFKFLIFTQQEHFPILFMSDEQMERNEIVISKYHREIISIFQNHQYKINNCEDLVEIYNQIFYHK